MTVFFAVLMITVADDVTIAVPVTISVTLTNRYASAAESIFFDSGRWFSDCEDTIVTRIECYGICSDKSAFLGKSSAAYMPHSSPMDAKL
jgi:hypothetical protein